MTSQSQGWYSVVGYMHMKPTGGAFSMLKPRKRMFFALEETQNQLTFFKDESDFVKRKEPVGTIPLANAACTVAEQSGTSFAIHANGRTYGFDADNERSAEHWMSALQNRRESVDLNENIRKTSRPLSRRPPKMSRSRSASLPSESELQSAQRTQRYTLDHRRSVAPFPRVLPTDVEARDDIGVVDKERVEGKGDRLPSWFDEWIRSWLNDQSFSVPPYGTEKTNITEARDAQQIDADDVSSTTSNCDSERASSISSEIVTTEELYRLREITNRQKERIQELNENNKKLIVQMSQLREFQSATVEAINDNFKATLIAQNKFLNAEVLRLSERSEAEQRVIEKLKTEKRNLEEDINGFRREYVFLLQSCIRIPLSEQHSTDVLQVKLLGGDIHKKRVLKLLEEARITDPTLPTFESIIDLGNYVDVYGFRRSFSDEGLALHYICTLLHAHYREGSQAEIEHRTVWKEYLKKCKHQFSNTPEARRLVRGGIPPSMRTTVWRMIIHQQVADVKKKYGKYYYRNLCNSQGTPAERQYCKSHQKQITLDLLRTMPTNVHFMSPTCKGIQQLEQVLRAYCLHNPSIGYCQGMNFIASTAMLFVGAEDTFWLLVAVTEKYFNSSYFDQSLTGAQADQEVLKELLCSRLPTLSAHLDACDIDLATVTLNWFLALFFDAVPFQTMIRIWDCFLLEGPKVLFRFSIALLSIHENEVLQRTDTISVMKILKASVRLTYDHEGLCKLAFDATQPFPSRYTIEQKQRAYLAVLEERLSRRKQLRQCLSTTAKPNLNDGYVIELVTFCGAKQGCGYICAGNQTKGIVSRFTITATTSTLQKLDHEASRFECRILSMIAPDEDIAFLSLLSAYIVAVHIKGLNVEILWELKLNDVPLKLLHYDEHLYAALASGTLTVIENVTELVPNELELYHLPIGAAPISDVVVVNHTLCLAVACKIVVLSIPSLTTLRCVYVASATCGSGVPLFEKIRCMTESPHGVWIVTAHSSLVQLWRNSECRLLFDISVDHSHKRPSFTCLDGRQDMEITMVLYVHEQIWIGTNDGYLIIYDVKNLAANDTSKLLRPPPVQEYPAGLRLSPKSGSVCAIHHLPTYYIPTESETRHDERVSVAEYPAAERQGRKVSMFMNQNTKRYSSLRKTASPKSQSPRPSLPVSIDVCRLNILPDPGEQSETRNRLLVPTSQRLSCDSAVSVFSSDDTNNENCPLSTVPKVRPSVFTLTNDQQEVNVGNVDVSDSRHCSPPNTTNPRASVHKSSVSSVVSMEYDDLFELYSETDDAMASTSNAVLADSSAPLSPCPRLSCDQRMPSTSTASMDPNRTSGGSNHTVASLSQSSSSKQSDEAWHDESTFKLRRKDLDFEETLAHSPRDELRVRHSNSLSEDTAFGGSCRDANENSITLVLDMKMKISDKSIKCAQATRICQETVVVTCAGNYDDIESILRWTIDRKDSTDELWINDPIVDEQLAKRLTNFHDN